MGFRRNANKATSNQSKPSAKTGSRNSGGKSYYNDIFQINEGQDGSLYLKLNEFKAKDLEITVNGKLVTGFISKDPMVSLEEAVESGRLSEEKAAEIAEKIPEFVKSNVTVVTE